MQSKSMLGQNEEFHSHLIFGDTCPYPNTNIKVFPIFDYPQFFISATEVLEDED